MGIFRGFSSAPVVNLCPSVCVQTQSWGPQRCGRPARPCRICTRRCWSQTWSTLWTRRWSRTCKRPHPPMLSLQQRARQSAPLLYPVVCVCAAGTMPSRTRSPHCRARPRTGPTPTAARSRPTCPCFWKQPVASTLRYLPPTPPCAAAVSRVCE